MIIFVYPSMQKHLKQSCQAASVTCEYCELTNIPRGNMSKHHTDECEEIQVECDFKSIGCDYSEVL